MGSYGLISFAPVTPRGGRCASTGQGRVDGRREPNCTTWLGLWYPRSMETTLKGRPRIYLDTSILSAYWDDRDPGRKAKTREFWQQLYSYEVFVSVMTIAEVERHPEETHRAEILNLLRPFTALSVTAEAEALADEYVGREVFPRAARADALHVAVATVHGVGIIVSWNFRHMVKLRTRQLLAAINPLLGYPVLQIVSPLEV